MHIVWFKRDLRVEDHAPLAEAAARGAVLPLYIAEPALWQQPEHSARQWQFVGDSLAALRDRLAGLGAPLHIAVGEAVATLAELHVRQPIDGIYSHEETGQLWSYRRDQAVAAWCRDQGIPWREWPQNGVIRGLRSRDGWAARWEARMRAPQALVPAAIRPAIKDGSHAIPGVAELGLRGDDCPGRQSGGAGHGHALLADFLAVRGHDYHRQISSPLTAERACSRLSPHLAWGTLSMRSIYQSTLAARQRMDPKDPAVRGPRRALAAFSGRLHWHCHFMQKLESEPRLEHENVHRGYDGLREHEWDAQRFAAWRDGRTGLPFVDACMRFLRARGWINFRMRAMLVAVSSYHLWLHWREPALFLARQFTDFEPGIHFNQVQMQSGTTGINTVRIYNPVKQGRDHDPEGFFVRRWVPELAGVPDARLHEPWKLSAGERQHFGAGCYPPPLVDHLAAARAARERVWAVRRSEAFRSEADAIQQRHGSRRAGLPPSGRSARRVEPSPQRDFWADGD